MMKKAFTLVELMIVIIILGVLAGLFITNFRSAKRQAEFKQLFTDMEALRAAEKQHKLETGDFVYCQEPSSDPSMSCNSIFNLELKSSSGEPYIFLYASAQEDYVQALHNNPPQNCTYTLNETMTKPELTQGDSSYCPLVP